MPSSFDDLVGSPQTPFFVAFGKDIEANFLILEISLLVNPSIIKPFLLISISLYSKPQA